MTLTDIGTIILAVATMCSLLYISRQVSITRKQTKGQFLLALDQQFEKTNGITLRLANEDGFKPAGTDWPEIWQLMSVYERINIMVEDGILDIGLIDRLYGFRVLLILRHDDIYHRISKTGAEWQDFIDLCYALADNRRRSTDPRDIAFIERVHTLTKTTHRMPNPWRF